MLLASPATTAVAKDETPLLQELSAEMVEAWQSREWGAQSDQNFADFCAWMTAQLSPEQ